MKTTKKRKEKTCRARVTGTLMIPFRVTATGRTVESAEQKAIERVMVGVSRCDGPLAIAGCEPKRIVLGEYETVGRVHRIRRPA